jgi:hypothetical protein
VRQRKSLSSAIDEEKVRDVQVAVVGRQVKMGPTVRLAALLLFLVSFPASAQQQMAPRPWQLHGSVGYSFSNSGTAVLNGPSTRTGTDFTTMGADLRLTLNGYFYDPRLMNFYLDFGGRTDTNDVNERSFTGRQLAWTFNTSFLPRSSYPFRIYYRQNNTGSRGAGSDVDSENSVLGLEWSLRKQDLPRVDIEFNRYANEVLFPISLSDVNFRQKTWELSATDEWKGWKWLTGASNVESRSSSVAGANLDEDLTQNIKALDAQAQRSLWGRKAELRLSSRSQWREAAIPGAGVSNTADSYFSGSLVVRHSDRLNSSYSYGYSRFRLEEESLLEAGVDAGNPFTLLAQRDFQSHNATGRVSYQLTRFLDVFEEVRYRKLKSPASTAESLRSLAESLSGLSFHEVWRGIEIAADYAGHFQQVGSTAGQSSNSFSHDFGASAAWGDPNRVRVRGLARYAKANFVDQLGGFDDVRRLRFEAETRRLKKVQFRFSAERSRLELLNLSGNIRSEATTWSLDASHRRFSVTFSRTSEDGAGAVFPAGLLQRGVFVVDLPIEELIDSPLLERVADGTAVSVSLNLIRNLSVGGKWSTQDSLLANSDVLLRRAEIRVRYRIGKISSDFGYGAFRTKTEALDRTTGSDVNRVYFRVARDFSIF